MKRLRFSIARNIMRFAFGTSGEVAIAVISIIAALIAAAYVLRPVAQSYNFGKDLDRCIKQMKDASDELNQRIQDNANNPKFQIAQNDPDYLTVLQCKDLISTVSAAIQAKNQASINNFTNLTSAIVQNVGSCKIISFNPNAFIGAPYATNVTANIPFQGSDVEGTLTMSGAVSANGNLILPPLNPPTVVGSFNIPLVDPSVADGATSQISLGASAPALATPIVDPSNPSGPPICPPASIPYTQETGGKITLCRQIVNINNKCPDGQTPAGSFCIVQCTPPAGATITWKKPPVPKVVSFSVNPSSIDPGSTSPVTLSWEISNAQSASIDQGIGDVAADPTKSVSGSLPLNPLPQKTTTFTLLAIGANAGTSDFKTATLVVKQPSAVTVTILSPKPDDQILDNGVTVSGLVTPPPAQAGALKAQIIVNGQFLSDGPVDTNGNFSVRTALVNTISVNDITLRGDPVVAVNFCGPISEPISITASPPNGSKNGIVVRVIAVAAPTTALGTASVTVEHVVSIQTFQYQWGGGCPGDPVGPISTSLGIVLRADQLPLSVGSVNCGFDSGPANCSDTADITVFTSAGSIEVIQGWGVCITADCGSCL